MFEEKDLSNKYVVFLMSTLLILIFGNLMVDFDTLDFLYLIFVIITILRYIKIRLQD